MLKASLAAVAGVAIGAAVTAVVYRASKPATDAPSSTKKAARAVERYEAALLTLELPECPSAVRRNRALIAAAVPRVTGCIYIAFEGGMDGSEDELDKNPGGGAGKQRVDTSVLVKALRHYDDVWDAAVGCGNPGLDCRVLLPCPGLATESSLWGLPELGAIFGQPNETLLDIVEQLNEGRASAGMPRVQFVSLAREAQRADFDHHIYFDDICGRLPRFETVVLGGTFDHLHVGHRKLLTTAILVARSRLVVGVTHDHMLVHKANKHLIQSFPKRCQAVRAFVHSVNPALNLDIVPIRDMYGPTVSDPSLMAIVVSSETAANAEKINAERVRRRMDPMAVVSLARVSAVSSSFLRTAQS